MDGFLAVCGSAVVLCTSATFYILMNYSVVIQFDPVECEVLSYSKSSRNGVISVTATTRIFSQRRECVVNAEDTTEISQIAPVGSLVMCSLRIDKTTECHLTAPPSMISSWGRSAVYTSLTGLVFVIAVLFHLQTLKPAPKAKRH
eukprot:TRINITY_DN105098_c0_g1_i1.p1 TRINITY_DN105098_c0_g1~~TRINITY_DN105098_c0_g1_i1.p1  ORF type:complete len:145 (+),score=10.89 TRINITY_DN105098_c0_g1_i1:29-463(+)